MGLVLEARCGACDFEQGELRLGGSHAQIADHDVSHYQVFAAGCCRRLQSVLIYLGQPLPEAPCAGCATPLNLERPYRIATLKGERLEAHACPACGGETLSFTRVSEFR